jgi:hypothetical protein
VRVGDLVRYKTNTIWDPDDLFIILKITQHKKTWHRRIFLYSPRVETGSIVVSWDEREILEVISEPEEIKEEENGMGNR